jgi:hypothetical protein
VIYFFCICFSFIRASVSLYIFIQLSGDVHLHSAFVIAFLINHIQSSLHLPLEAMFISPSRLFLQLYHSSYNIIFFLNSRFICNLYTYIKYNQKIVVEKRGRLEECSVAPLRDKRVKTLCGCREKSVQTKEKYKLRLTTKAYKLSYNYINYIINLVGRSFGKWRRRRLHSGGSRRVRRMSFGCVVRRAL